MALEQAILDIAEQLLAEAQDFDGKDDAGHAYLRSTLRGYARQLKSVVKAAERDPAQAPATPAFPQFLSADFQNVMMIEEAKKARREEKRLIEAQENVGVNGSLIALCIGGRLDGTVVPITPEMPVGAKSLLEGQVYIFESDRHYHFDEETTKEEYKRRGKEYVPDEKPKILLA